MYSIYIYNVYRRSTDAGRLNICYPAKQFKITIIK